MQPVHGLEVSVAVEKMTRARQNIPIIVVTIVDQPGIGTAFSAPTSIWLKKPVDKATLLAGVERCLRSRGKGGARHGAILVVEDDASTAKMIEELLTRRRATR